ncbi:hypothetical protein L209DRAFT_121400 [Thermothelomyces heterothallicus CBS 203.75]
MRLRVLAGCRVSRNICLPLPRGQSYLFHLLSPPYGQRPLEKPVGLSKSMSHRSSNQAAIAYIVIPVQLGSLLSCPPMMELKLYCKGVPICHASSTLPIPVIGRRETPDGGGEDGVPYQSTVASA